MSNKSDKEFFEHPLVKPNKMQLREYQKSILATAKEKNTLCVLPTGLGKTGIAILLALERMRIPESKILMLAPTKPLVNQHYKTFLEFLNIDEDKMQVLTGEIRPTLRKVIYEEKTFIFATPQTIQNDLETKKLSLNDFSLLVLDEIHHSIGDYAYPYIVKKYLEQAKDPRILGLTASPGGTEQKIKEICENSGIEAVEIRTEEDQDVSAWVKEKDIEWVSIELPKSFIKIKQVLDEVYKEKIKKLKSKGASRLRTKRDILELQAYLAKEARKGDKSAFGGLFLAGQAIKLEHSIGLLETQGIGVLESYWKKLRKDASKAGKALVNDKRVLNAMRMSNELYEMGSKHPKISKLCSIIDQQIRAKPNSKIIVFASYRDSVKEIYETLQKIDRAHPVMLIGQKEGLSQKQQIDVIKDFESDIYNCLITTSIGEEGLHISSADIAIFYEPVPSEVRNIQRRGRVGRVKIGSIIIFITKNTRDEAYYWTAQRKEGEMKKTLSKMKKKNQI
ncbi:MAG: DEAD/DEAH box helicase [Nanoarchaeota archaeon]